MNKSLKKIGWIFLGIFLVWCVLIGLRNWYDATHPEKDILPHTSSSRGVAQGSSAESLFSLPKIWKYHSGDDMVWAGKDFEDSSWDMLPILLNLDSLPKGTFAGICWFRTSVNFDSSQTNKIFGLKVSHCGASEIYLDGKLIQEFGKVSSYPEEESGYMPNHIPAIFIIQSPGLHSFAVRYSNLKYDHYKRSYGEVNSGITLQLLADYSKELLSWESLSPLIFFVTLLFGFFFTLSLIHFLLFIFYRQQRQNLYYSLFTFVFSLLFLALQLSMNSTDPEVPLFVNHYSLGALLLLLLTLIKLLQMLFHPKGSRVTFSIGVFMTLSALFLNYFNRQLDDDPGLTGIVIGIFLVFATVEFIRSVIAGLRKNMPGSKIIGTGALFFALFLVILMLIAVITGSISINLSDSLAITFVILVIAAIVSIPLSMSIYLAYDFSLTNRNLQKKLIEVEDLSAQTLAQEKEKQEIMSKQKETLEIQVKERTREIVEQKQVIEEKNKDITDSINYAKRIQEALLSNREIKYRLFPDAFVLFLPKDVVSGDFYWFTEKNGKRLIAAVDCTGHGVPGAFMSMIGNTFLNEIVDEKGITQPGLILNELRDMIVKTLKQSGGESKDGMDIALLSFDNQNKTVEYAGANNPLWLIRDGAVTEFKADKQPIGYHSGATAPFTNHSVELRKGDVLYIFSDGFADQFGGEKGKKFKYKQLLEVLLTMEKEPMMKQEEILLQKFNSWKGALDQVDDLLVIGVRV